ncbi:hypothetical protein BGZ75_002506, partial [Mortierella antarctica]
METAPKGVRIRRNATHVEEVGQPLHLPALEPHSSDPAEAEDGAAGGYPGNTLLAIGNMVPNSDGDGSGSTSTNTPCGRTTRAGKRKQHPGQERQMESVSVARKRQTLIAKGLSTEAAAFITGNRDALRTQQRYKATQEAFLDWVQEGSFDLDIDPAVPIVNWLYQIMATGNLQ